MSDLTDSERAELDAYRAAAAGVGMIPPTPVEVQLSQTTEVPFSASVNETEFPALTGETEFPALTGETEFPALTGETEFPATVDPIADAAAEYRKTLTAAQLGHPEPTEPVEAVVGNG